MMIVTHVVRTYGSRGGMEYYVWRLTQELAHLGIKVRVVCETSEVTSHPSIEVITLKRKITKKHRWRAMLDFSNHVAQILSDTREDWGIIHSHERCTQHHVTTFHGQPIFGLVSRGHKISWTQKFTWRVYRWQQMEKAELLNDSVRMVVPVSDLVGNSLKELYPAVGKRMAKPGWPGVDQSSVVPSDCLPWRDRRKALLFVGVEWKRKGLELAVEVLKKIRERDGLYTLDVFGCDRAHVSKNLRNVDGVTYHGWVKEVPFEQYGILLLPAKAEAYGIVVAEARMSGLAVLVSDRVGAGGRGFENVWSIPFASELTVWSDEICRITALTDIHPEIKDTWDELARWYVESVYSEILSFQQNNDILV